MSQPQPCPLCGGNSHRLLCVEQGYPIRICNDCRFIAVNPRPSSEDLTVYYDYYYEEGPGSEVWDKAREQSFRRCVEWLQTYHPGGRLLDVGCGYGGFLRAAKVSGFDVEGLELSEAACEHVRSSIHVPVTCGTTETVQAERSRYQVVTLLDVLEHLPDPVETLRWCSTSLQPGGVLLVRVPNMAFHLLKFRLVRPLLAERGVYFDPPGHLNGFSPAVLRRLLENTGFKCRKMVNGVPMWHGGASRALLLGGFHRLAEFVRALSRESLILGNSLEIYASKGS